MNESLEPLTERLAKDLGIDSFLRRDTLIEIIHLRRKLTEAETAEVDLKSEIERHQRLRLEGASYIAGLQRENRRLREGLKRLAMDRSDGPSRRIAQAILDESTTDPPA